MGKYRYSRNIEASIIDYLEEQLAEDWANISIEKTFARIYDIPLNPKLKSAGICVRCGLTVHNRAETGSTATVRNPQILIDLFCISDGQRLDLKDYLITKLKVGMPYYDYTIVKGQVTDKTQDGRIRVISISDVPVNFAIDKDKLDIHDRYRHILTLSVSLGKVEA